MKKEFNLSVSKGKYKPREARGVNCLFCGKEYQAKTRDGCCSPECKINRKHLLEQEYRKAHKKEFADWVRKYAHNNQNKIRDKAKRTYKKDRDKILVRANTYNSNEKTGICNDCKNKGKTQFHHLSYTPNIFIELCKKCHNKIHGRDYYGR